MKKKNALVNMVAVLFTITLVASAGVGYVMVHQASRREPRRTTQSAPRAAAPRDGPRRRS